MRLYGINMGFPARAFAVQLLPPQYYHTCPFLGTGKIILSRHLMFLDLFI
jgi:hypothetical protein